MKAFDYKKFEPGLSFAQYTRDIQLMRRRTARIVRRKEPTVDMRAASALPECGVGEEESSGGYSTVETNPHRTLNLLDRCAEKTKKSRILRCVAGDKTNISSQHLLN